MTIQVSENASRQIRKVLDKQGIPGGGLRVAVKAGGCSGLGYVFGWEGEPRQGDRVFEGIEGEDVRYRVYRDATPLTSPQSLISAELAAEVTGGELPFRDVPREDGVYYYAITVVIGNEEKPILVPYHNATVSAVDFSPLPRPVETFEIRREKGTMVSIPLSPLDPVSQSWQERRTRYMRTPRSIK